MTETKIIIIRHGETNWNIEGRWQGHLNSDLTEQGIKQAKSVRKGLINYQISGIYSSDLGRAAQTAKIIFENRNKDIVFDKRLRERNLGILQGKTLAEMSSNFPEAYREFSHHNPDYVISEGESNRHVIKRSQECLIEIARKHSGETIAVVSHGGVISGLFKEFLGIPLSAPRRFKVMNASINVFMYTSDKFELLTFGNVDHLNHLSSIDDDSL